MNIEREAIAVLARHGWRGIGKPASPRDGRPCVFVAMGRTGGLSDVAGFDAAVERVAAVIREQYPERTMDRLFHEQVLFRFNDHPDTTVEDVILVLTKASVRRDEVVG